MKKVLFLVPHLSTGGMPQYTYDLMRKIKNDVVVYCVEYSMVSPHFVVQRNKIINLLGDNFFCLGENKEELFKLIEDISPDIIHLQEVPEYFLDGEIATKLYSPNRNYLIVETSHDSSFPASSKRFNPDHFALISQYQKNEFSKLGIPISFIEADIEYKERQDRETGLKKLGLDPSLKHVLNVGLFTPRKNQAEAIEYARSLENYPIQFHFVGNQADNFADYWKPLLQNLPSNVKIWGERSDVDDFYSCMDLMLFTSRGTGNDKETSPLVIREAIGYNLPSLIYNLPVYLNMYDKYETITYLTDDMNTNIEYILKKTNIDQQIKKESTNVFHTLNGVVDFDAIEYKNSMYETMITAGDAAAMWWGTFLYKELERGGVKIEEGDVFVDLGANIGISSIYALKQGASKVYCFEPDPVILGLLEKNIPHNRVSFNNAISETKSEIELYHWPYNDVNVGPKYKVKTITLDDVFHIVGEPFIDYLKMDIEGFEESVFDGVSKNALQRIRKMFIEHHRPETTDKFVEKMKELGFDVYVEYGSGQNYIYCLNKELQSPHVTYDNTSNKINYTVKRTLKNALVSIKDIDSGAVIWSSKYDILPENIEFWMIPVPKQFYDFEVAPEFGGFDFELYENDKLIYKKSFRIKEISISKPRVRIVNSSEPTFVNYNEFFVQRIYEKYLKGKDFDIVVDVGANVGLWTEYVESVSNVKHVYMIEPNLNALDILHKSFQDKNHTIIPNALSSVNGELTFFINEENSLISSVVKDHQNSFGGTNLKNQYTVNSIRFDTFLEKYGIEKINLMKIDIEGAEYELFDSMGQKEFDIIDNILFEYHLSTERTLERDVNNIMDRLKSYGFNSDFSIEHSVGGFVFATKNMNSKYIQLHLDLF
jgi:FkbM family methyltransferase